MADEDTTTKGSRKKREVKGKAAANKSPEPSVIIDPKNLRSWPADRVERWPLARIKPYPKNARLHSEDQVVQIAKSMKQFGVTTPVLVDRERGRPSYFLCRPGGGKMV